MSEYKGFDSQELLGKMLSTAKEIAQSDWAES